MAVQLRRPILVVGIGLSLGLWLLGSIHESVAEFGQLGIWGAIALATGWWWMQHREYNQLELPSPSSPLDRAAVEKAIAIAETTITQLEAETTTPAELRQQVIELTTQLERQELQLTITGGKGVGKTKLVQVLASQWLPQEQATISLQETLPLFIAQGDPPVTPNSDLVLFVITGDLTDTEFQTLQQLQANNQRTLVVFNKQDQYLPPERTIICQHLRQRLAGIIPATDIVAISAAPTPVKVRQHQADTSVQEWMEAQTPHLTPLTQRLSQIITLDRQQLIWANIVRQTAALKAKAKLGLNQVRSDRALPIIEQYQWIAAASAFANPVPALDLLATAAISTQLVIELGAIYQQKFSLPQAQSTAKTLGTLMLKLGLVELSTQTISTILKSNTFTYIAGGAVQGISAAYLTRLAGLSLIEYLQEQEIDPNLTPNQPFNVELVIEKLQKVFQQNQRMAFWQGFVQQAITRKAVDITQPQMSNS